MANIKYQSRVSERTNDGTVNTLVYFGTKDEMLAYQTEHPVGEYTDNGRLRSNRVAQDGGDVWTCELRYETGNYGECAEAPPTEYGKKSAQLKGSMLSMPLETAPRYKACWNYYLAAAPGVTAVPSFWMTATEVTMSSEIAKSYRWVKSPSELPSDTQGQWSILKTAVKPGVESRDIATYSVTESARFENASKAGRMVADRLNRIGHPDNTFGISDGDWKCDDASISWTGKYWLATLTWTRSGDSNGWDQDLYG